MIKSLIWYIKNPDYYIDFFVLLFNELKNTLFSLKIKKNKKIAKRLCEKRKVSSNEALSLIMGNYDGFKKLFSEELNLAKKIEMNCPVKMGGAGDLSLLYNLTEFTSATKVIETGVAYGWSSLAILLSLKKRQESLLVSTDKPYPSMDNEWFVGCIVPDELKSKWKLIRQSDRKGVPKAIRIVGKADLCHYDSDKTYEGRMKTYPLLWKSLREGGIFISDDISDNLAFFDFCEKINKESIIVGNNDKFVGIIIK